MTTSRRSKKEVALYRSFGAYIHVYARYTDVFHVFKNPDESDQNCYLRFMKEFLALHPNGYDSFTGKIWDQLPSNSRQVFLFGMKPPTPNQELICQASPQLKINLGTNQKARKLCPNIHLSNPIVHDIPGPPPLPMQDSTILHQPSIIKQPTPNANIHFNDIDWDTQSPNHDYEDFYESNNSFF